MENPGMGRMKRAGLVVLVVLSGCAVDLSSPRAAVESYLAALSDIRAEELEERIEFWEWEADCIELEIEWYVQSLQHKRIELWENKWERLDFISEHFSEISALKIDQLTVRPEEGSDRVMVEVITSRKSVEPTGKGFRLVDLEDKWKFILKKSGGEWKILEVDR